MGSWGKYSGPCLSPLSPHRRTPARRGASQSLALGRQKLTALDRCGELSRVRHLFHISLARRRESPHHEKQSIFHPEHKTHGNVPFKFLSASITPKSHSKTSGPSTPTHHWPPSHQPSAASPFPSSLAAPARVCRTGSLQQRIPDCVFLCKMTCKFGGEEHLKSACLQTWILGEQTRLLRLLSLTKPGPPRASSGLPTPFPPRLLPRLGTGWALGESPSSELWTLLLFGGAGDNYTSDLFGGLFPLFYPAEVPSPKEPPLMLGDTCLDFLR